MKAIITLIAVLLNVFILVAASGILTVISFSMLKGDFRHESSRSTGKEKSIRVTD